MRKKPRITNRNRNHKVHRKMAMVRAKCRRCTETKLCRYHKTKDKKTVLICKKCRKSNRRDWPIRSV